MPKKKKLDMQFTFLNLLHASRFLIFDASLKVGKVLLKLKTWLEMKHQSVCFSTHFSGSSNLTEPNDQFLAELVLNRCPSYCFYFHGQSKLPWFPIYHFHVRLPKIVIEIQKSSATTNCRNISLLAAVCLSVNSVWMIEYYWRHKDDLLRERLST